VMVPFLPGVRSLPRRIPIYKLIWRRHYETVTPAIQPFRSSPYHHRRSRRRGRRSPAGQGQRMNRVDRTTSVTVRMTPGVERMRSSASSSPFVSSAITCSSALARRRPCGRDDARLALDGALDLLPGHPALAVEVDERLGMPPERLRVDDRRVAEHDAVTLEPVQPALDRGRREVDLLPDVLKWAASVLAQQRNDSSVNLVQSPPSSVSDTTYRV